MTIATEQARTAEQIAIDGQVFDPIDLHFIFKSGPYHLEYLMDDDGCDEGSLPVPYGLPYDCLESALQRASFHYGELVQAVGLNRLMRAAEVILAVIPAGYVIEPHVTRAHPFEARSGGYMWSGRGRWDDCFPSHRAAVIDAWRHHIDEARRRHGIAREGYRR